MKNTFKRLILCAVIVLTSLTGTGFSKQVMNVETSSVQRPVQYSQISYETISRNPGLERWYQRNYQRMGIHSRRHRGATYVLLSAGQRPTGGYSVVLRDIRRISRGGVFITASVVPPSPGTVVTQALTYPHLLIRIDEPRITRVEGNIIGLTREENSQEEVEE